MATALFTHAPLPGESLPQELTTLMESYTDAEVGIFLVCLSDGYHDYILASNPALSRMTGYDCDELRRLRVSELTHPDDANTHFRASSDLVLGKRAYANITTRYIHKDGTEVMVQTSMTVLRDNEGFPIAVLVQLENARQSDTQLAQSELQLAEAERRFRMAFDDATIGMTMIHPDGHWLLINSSYCEMLGYSKEEFANMQFSDVVSADELQRDKDFIREALRGGAQSRSCTKHYRHKNGSTVIAETRWDLVRASNGRPLYFITQLQDVTQYHAMLKSVRRSDELQRTLTANLPGTIIMLFDHDLRFLAIEGSIDKMTDYFQNLLGKTLYEAERTPDDLMNETVKRYQKALEGVATEQDIAFEDNVMHSTITPVHNEDGSVYAGLVVLRDVTKERADEYQMAHLAQYDQLTNLPNRALFKTRLEETVFAAKRGTSSALFFLDLNDFKSVNDTLGHDAGDELLKEVADRIADAVRMTDSVARLSGDEFTVIVQDIQAAEEIAGVAQRVLDAINKPAFIGETELFPQASLGIALIDAEPAGGLNSLELVKAADIAMYAAKAAGGNTYRFFDPALADEASQRLMLAADLHRAVERDEMVLHYQPQLNMQTGEIISAEALVRWNHPVRGMVPPFDFISIAESTGLIVGLGEWVLRTAVAQTAEWHKQGIKLRIAVNVSPAQFRKNEFPALVEEVLRESGLPAEYLELEITESTLEENDYIGPALNSLKSLGVHLTIDDFGTGYSSLSRLKGFPIDVLKIDRSFVQGLGKNEDDEAIVHAIIVLAKALGLTVLAEGIESEQQKQFLRGEGCDMCSGWLFSKAIPDEELTDLMSCKTNFF